ncbi:MAG: MtrB/PioB family outer membrane beta-barrel protein [Candidatus Sulfotelmatobacter sp.]
MFRRIQFGTPIFIVVAGVLLALASVSALASPQASASGAGTAASQADQPANSVVAARDASQPSSAPAASAGQNAAGTQADAQSSAEPPLYAERSKPFEAFLPKSLNVASSYRVNILENMAPPDDAASSSQPASPDQSSSSSSDNSNQPPHHVAEDPTQPGSNFPPWALYSTRVVDPRVRPNTGIRLPAIIPNFSPVVPDFDHTLADTRNWSVKVSLAEFETYLSSNSSKFNEFRDVRDGAVAGVEAHYRGDKGKYLNVLGRNLGRKDEDLNIEGGLAGKYILSFYDDWTPHNYMFGARSLYTGVGTGNLTIADGIRADVQNSTSITQADAKLLAYDNQQGTPVDLSLQREKVGGDVTFMKTFPWVFKVGAVDESRDGERPWSASFGFSNFVEIPWAVHYDLSDYHASAEWAKEESRVYFIANFRTSVFDDHDATQTFSNPFRVTDSANLTGTFDGGPATGRIPLYPSNESYEPSGILVIKDLAWDSTLSWTVAAAFGYQNQRLIPFSTNTADTVYNTAGAAFNATDPAALPRQFANASVNSENTQVRWTAKPSDHLHLDLEYRAFRNDITTPRFVTADFVREDQDVRTPVNQCNEPCSANYTFSSLPIGYTRQTATVKADYEFGRENRLGLTYTFDTWDRNLREIKYEDDNKIRLTYDTKAKKWLDLKSWYEHTTRTTSKYNFNEWHDAEGDSAEFTALPFLHKMDEAPYNKDDIQLIATFTLNDAMSISTQGLFSMTHYTNQTFGLIDNSHQSYSADYTYDANDRVSFFADYGYEQFHSRLYDRAFVPDNPCDPYSNAPGYFSYCNWGGYPVDAYNTAGAGFDAYFIPKKFHTTLYYTLSKNHGTQKYTSTLGPPSLDPDQFTPQPFNQVDSVTYHTINQELEYKFTKVIALSAGYQYEFWHDNDYNYVGFNYVNQYASFNITPLNTIGGSNLLMGGLLPPFYHANVAYFRLKFGL